MNPSSPKTTSDALAQGMSNIYDEVSTPIATAIKQDLVEHFGKGLYYRLKSGEKLITPEQQTYIAEVFAKHGAPTPPVYDTILPTES